MCSTAVTGALALLLTVAPVFAEAAVACARPDEGLALSARALQTDLMVSALVCARQDDYNAFVTRFRGELAGHAGLMRRYFQRRYGRLGEKRMNGFVTRLANEASRASNENRALYCRATSTLFDGMAGAAGPQAFELVLRDPLLAARHGVPACGAPR